MHEATDTRALPSPEEVRRMADDARQQLEAVVAAAQPAMLAARAALMAGDELMKERPHVDYLDDADGVALTFSRELGIRQLDDMLAGFSQALLDVGDWELGTGNTSAEATPYVCDQLVVAEASQLVRSAMRVVERFSRLHDQLSEEAGEGVDISEEAFDRSGADAAIRALHVAQSILSGATGSACLTADELQEELRAIWPESDAEQAS